MKLSELLWIAANKYLAENKWEYSKHPHKCSHSCNAVWGASKCDVEYRKATAFLRSLGCPVASLTAFYRFETEAGDITPESQGARYAWLMFASMVAEERGL